MLNVVAPYLPRVSLTKKNDFITLTQDGQATASSFSKSPLAFPDKAKVNIPVLFLLV